MSRIPLGMLYSYANIYTYRDDNSLQHHTNNRLVSVDVAGTTRLPLPAHGCTPKAGSAAETTRNWPRPA